MAEPKRALVTGASSGIGRGVACRLAQDGWHIVIHGRRQEALEETLAMVEAAGGTGEICRAEMGDMEQVAELGACMTAYSAARIQLQPVKTRIGEDYAKNIQCCST